MGKLIKIQSDEGDVIIAVPTNESLVQPVSVLEDTIQNMQLKLNEMLPVVARIGKSFKGVVADSGAGSADIEFGLQFSAKGNVYVVATEALASFKVTLKFASESS